MSKRVLATGFSGFVGSNVLKYLLKNTTWTFTCLASWKHRGNPLYIDATNPRVTVITHDLQTPIPEIGNFDIVISAASDSHVCRSIQDPVNFIMNNVAIISNTLEYARTHPCEAFLHLSTDEVYSDKEHGDWDVLLPSSPYASSKAAQEMVCISYFRTFGVPVVLVNSNNIFGPNQHKEKYIPKILELIRWSGNVYIHTVNGKPGKRNYNYVDNISSAMQFILEKTVPNVYPEQDRPSRYSLPGGEELDNLEVAQLIAEYMGKRLNYIEVEGESVRPGYDKFYPREQGSKLQELGFIPIFSTRDELKKLVENLD